MANIVLKTRRIDKRDDLTISWVGSEGSVARCNDDDSIFWLHFTLVGY